MAGRKKTVSAPPKKSPVATQADLAALRLEVKEDLQREIAKCATKEDLAALRAELKAEIAQCATKEDLQRQSADLFRHINAMVESFQAAFRVVDDKYDDLPARVTKLERHANIK